jgi:hypothetical protein
MDNIPIGQWSGSDAVNELHQSIKEFNATMEKQNRTLVKLTWVIAILTFLNLAGLVVQAFG